MKKLFCIITALALILALCACTSGGSKTEETPAPTEEPSQATAEVAEAGASPEPTETPSPTPSPVETPKPTATVVEAATPSPTAVPTPTITSAPQSSVTVQGEKASGDYSFVINAYTSALTYGWSGQECVSNGISSLVNTYYTYGNADVLGYCYTDVNGDGVSELLVGEGNLIISMYTQQNGATYKVFEGTERSSWHLEPDGLLVNNGSNSAYQSAYVLYNLSGSSLVYKGAIISDYSVNYNEPWFYASDNDWNVNNDQKVTNATAEKWINAYESNYVYPQYISFTTGSVISAASYYGPYYAAAADDYGYQTFIADRTGNYTFTVSGSGVDWEIYVLDSAFTDAERFIPQAYSCAARNGGTVYITQGQFVYIYCSANQWTGITAPSDSYITCVAK